MSKNKNPWVEAPMATVMSPEELQHVQRFQRQTITHARLQKEELGHAPHSRHRVSPHEITGIPALTDDERLRRRKAKYEGKASIRRKLAIVALAAVGAAATVAGIERAVAQDSHSRTVNNPTLAAKPNKGS